MPNYTIEDIMNNPENTHKLTGYVGKILRLNLTEQTTELISTYKYVPKYLGGRHPLLNRMDRGFREMKRRATGYGET